MIYIYIYIYLSKGIHYSDPFILLYFIFLFGNRLIGSAIKVCIYIYIVIFDDNSIYLIVFSSFI